MINRREDHPFIPYLSIKFEKEYTEESTIKNTGRLSGIRDYFQNTDSLEAFTDSILKLKSMYDDREIYWNFKPNQMEVCIYFDPITKNDNPDLI